MKFDIITADPPWQFSDKLTMSDVKRGAESNYQLLSLDKIIKMPVSEITADDAVLALWVPSSLLAEGLKVMEAWGFEQKQVWVWVKVKNNPLESLFSALIKAYSDKKSFKNILKEVLDDYSVRDWFDELLAFGMGRIGRNVHELVLVGTKGKILSRVKSKSERTVFFHKVTKHSAKPEILQDKLDRIFPDQDLKRLEIFGRRLKDGWTVIGNQCPSSMGEDIYDSIERLKNLT